MTVEQLSEIKKASLSRITSDNTDLKVVQMNPFMFTNERANARAYKRCLGVGNLKICFLTFYYFPSGILFLLLFV
jgi:hypothetical protein